MPDDALAHVHPGLGLVVVPAPFRQQAGREGKIGVLPDILIVDRAIDRLDRRIDRRRPCRRIERRQVDVEGDRQLVAGLRESPTAAEDQLGQKARGAQRQRFSSIHFDHVPLQLSYSCDATTGAARPRPDRDSSPGAASGRSARSPVPDPSNERNNTCSFI